MIELMLKPTPTSGRYAAERDGVHIVTSRQPFYDAARVLLLGQDVAPETELQARWVGSEIVAMRSTVGEAARWTVSDPDRGKMKIVLWAPHPMAVSRRLHAAENALEGAGWEEEATEPGNAPDDATPCEQSHGQKSAA